LRSFKRNDHGVLLVVLRRNTFQSHVPYAGQEILLNNILISTRVSHGSLSEDHIIGRGSILKHNHKTVGQPVRQQAIRGPKTPRFPVLLICSFGLGTAFKILGTGDSEMPMVYSFTWWAATNELSSVCAYDYISGASIAKLI
jgi:hypothetical protein